MPLKVPACPERHPAVVVMGVSGCGKTSVGERLAERLGVAFVEGDRLHPEENVAKMARGMPLTDEDRGPWLDLIGGQIAATGQKGEGIVVTCSALKRAYRDRLRQAAGALAFVYLKGTPDLLKRRMSAREGHFMPVSLLESQLETLEEPAGEPGVVIVDIDNSTETIVATALGGLAVLQG